MKRTLNIKNLLINIVILIAITSIGHSAYITLAATGIYLLAVWASKYQVCNPFTYCADIQKEIWQDHIEGNLFKDNEFLLTSVDASQYVLQGKIVHIPQAGAVTAVQKNRAELPAAVVQRTDTDITYALDVFTSDPMLIDNAETVELSYNKRESILSESEAAIREVTADNILIDWAPSLAARIIRTTGEAVASTLDGTTGSRKRFLTKDLKAAQLAMNKQNISAAGRYALISADMFQQLTDSLTETQFRDFSSYYNAKTGVVGQLFGFNIMMRSNVVSYDNSNTPIINPYGNAANATDNDAVLCWQTNAIERALGDLLFFEHIGDPTYYGDKYSILVRMGARKRRADEKGLIAIIQASAN